MADIRWTASLVEERLVEAADTLKRLPEPRMRGYTGTWPSIVRDYWEAYGREEVKLRRGPPQPGAIDRMDEALVWLSWLEPDDARIVWLRASGERWKAICWQVGLARAAAHRHWLFALSVIAWRLAGGRIPANRARQRIIDMVREGR